MRTAATADQAVDQAPTAPARRVRDQAREAVALMAFSAATSGGLAVALLLLARLGR